MKKKNTNEKRVINIPKEDFETIRGYCDENAYNMPKWIVKTVLQIINGDQGKYDTPDNSYRSLINSEIQKCKDNPFYLKEKYGIDENSQPSWLKGEFDSNGIPIVKK